MERYSLRLMNVFQDDETGILARIVDLRTYSHSVSGLMKVPRYNIEPFSSHLRLPINEVYVRLTLEKINDIDHDNEKRYQFINGYLRPKIRIGKLNIPLINIEVDKKPNAEEMEQISQFITDIIYAHPHITLAMPPKITMPREIRPTEKENLFKSQVKVLSETLKSYSGSVQLAYFIPDYVPRASIPKLIENYVSNFGDNALLILDMNGKRFSAGGYSDVSLIHREMRNRHIEDYAIYLFNHKGRKRSGKEVPSEDLLAFLNGVNFVGPMHRAIPLPPDVVERITGSLGKIFNREDFLFYPEMNAPNIEEFQKFSRLRRSRYRMLQIFNDAHINYSASELSSDPISTISYLARPDFKDALKTIAKKRQSIVRQRTLSDLL